MKFKRKRASFSAPTPPAPPPTDDVVENDKPDKKEPLAVEEVAKTEPAVEPDPISAKAPTPPAKVVSRETTKDKETTINEVLNDSAPPQQKPPEINKPEPEPEPQPELTETEVSMQLQSEKSSSNFLLIMITVFALVLGIAGWLLYFNASGTINLAFISSSPEVTPTPAPTTAPTPTPNLRADVVLDVLNGSGVAGAAGATADDLEKLGYEIATIGNAANQNFTEAEVYTGEDLTPDQEMLLLSDLTDLFGPATISGVLTNDSTASAQIIVGKDWQE